MQIRTYTSRSVFVYNLYMMIKAVLFDMNGIIIDDEHIHEMIFKRTVTVFGINLSHKEYLECCAGKTDEVGYDSIARKFNVNLPVKDLLDEKSKEYLKLFPDNFKKYSGIVSLIKRLHKSFVTALTSSSSKMEIDLVLKELDIFDYFKVIVSANDVSRGKPDPEPYLITASKLNVKPAECVVIEDSKSGIVSAKEAGCYCIAIPTTHVESDLEKADLIVKSFDEINKEVVLSLVK
jgi:HAD superfamily hydrolase (TIGR01509 family)